jgi:phage gpG-like protein
LGVALLFKRNDGMSKLNLRAREKAFNKVRHEILERAANAAINQFKVVNFDAQGFVDGGIDKWKPRSTKSGKYKDGTVNLSVKALAKDKGRKILVKTGRLRQSISVIKKSFDSRTVGSEVPYADFINEGTKKMPKRQYIGKSKDLDNKIESIIAAGLAKL